MMRQAGHATPIVHGSDMTAIATVRGGSARVCAYLFSAALRNAAMQTAEANGPVQRKHAGRSSSVPHLRYAWRPRGPRLSDNTAIQTEQPPCQTPQFVRNAC
ncbi:hypothetical protein DB811_10850 [Xanthomonas perforans]|uniref:Uncharacterized protein n=1 Tax=Xanthomonas perforans TaxID=442694 RepID=A0AAQ0YNQ7_XANPE|nr:hypothetical protein BJD13_14725 [Xanthomonas perforans]AQS76642.1 hypothetical protein XPE_10380 [Xanthomonas perforans 91-118]PWH23029.1 hypothetical protein CDO09_14170 [Xanthomonas perforans]RXD37434.1 hypothetical protein DB854_06665 [Xanthomonas perforans]RXD40028.1 hypothetical protein DB761_19425 [Xanthomonas perforans]